MRLCHRVNGLRPEYTESNQTIQNRFSIKCSEQYSVPGLFNLHLLDQEAKNLSLKQGILQWECLCETMIKCPEKSATEITCSWKDYSLYQI